MVNFVDLPDTVLRQVCKRLVTPSDILQLASSCRRCQFLATDATLWSSLYLDRFGANELVPVMIRCAGIPLPRKSDKDIPFYVAYREKHVKESERLRERLNRIKQAESEGKSTEDAMLMEAELLSSRLKEIVDVLAAWERGRGGFKFLSLAVERLLDILGEFPDHPAGYHLLAQTMYFANGFKECLMFLSMAKHLDYADNYKEAIDGILSFSAMMINC